MIVQACLNGARSPGHHPRLPTSIEALAADAAATVRAGAGELHLHVRRAADGAESLRPEDVDEGTLASRLYDPSMREVDLCIRTAGELRVSNFLLWQISYAEIYVTETLWPDFRAEHLHAAIRSYASRERRFGGLVGR